MTPTLMHPALEALADRFRFHAERIYGRHGPNGSLLYAYLADYSADDPDILSLLLDADPATTVTNLLFGAVHDLLLAGADHPLGDFYATLVDNPAPPEDAFPYFQDFCQEYRAEIVQRVTTRRIQTNEVLRCTGLMLAFGQIGERVGATPLAVLEIGASAGLNLLWDHYTYEYQGVGTVGVRSALRLSCELRGEHLPPLPAIFPQVDYRLGIDVAPLNIHNEADVRWLQALIWPEQTDRVDRLWQAIRFARTQRVPLIKGDAARILPTVLRGIPAQMPLVIFHTDTFNQMPGTTQDTILDTIDEHAAQRDLYRVSIEWYPDAPSPPMKLHTYRDGEMLSEHLADVESHGRWVEWRPRWY